MKIEEYEISRHISYKEWINGDRKYLLSDYPYLDIVTNDTCNKSCNFCIAYLIEKKEKCNPEINKQKIKFAIEQMGVKEVLIVGGESTIRYMDKVLFETLIYLNQFKLNKICLTTNGLRLNNDIDYLLRIIDSGITHINLSLMDLNGDIDIEKLYYYLRGNIHLRINNNVWRGNNDTVEDIIKFYDIVSKYSDSVKFSPLLKTDSFSVVNEVSEWVRAHILSDNEYDNLWKSIEDTFEQYPILRNRETFGFVEYSMILMDRPLILNYNQHGNLRKKVIEENKINNIKLLTNGELSLSWNRNDRDYLIKTN